MIFSLGLVAALAAGDKPPAFDNATCASFLVGTWVYEEKQQASVRVSTLMLGEDGSFSGGAGERQADGQIEGGSPTTGRWSANPAPDDGHCTLSLALPLGDQTTKLDEDITVIDGQTIVLTSRGPDAFKRQ